MNQSELAHGRTVHIMSYPGVSLLDLAGALDVFLAANYFADPSVRPYRISVLALQKNVEVLSGVSLDVVLLDDKTTVPDIFIVPGGAGIEQFCHEKDFSIFIKHATKAARLVSVCTGIFALAYGGFLDGKKVTTHWSAYDELARQFPEVNIERGPIFVRDGNLWTSAGVTAGIDLALSLVEEDLGHSAALVIARHLIVFLKRPAGQNQYSASLMFQSESSRFSDLHAWMTANIAEDLSVPVLAAYMNMSERTFVRNYSSEIGRTPKKTVEALRLEAARNMLVNSRRPLKEIALKAGLGSEATLIRLFTKALGVTPGEYRKNFGKT